MNPVTLFKCLGDETRLQCLLLVHQEGELCVCELTAALGEIQPKISRHLAQLRSCELVTDRRQGQWIFYRINPALPPWAQQIINVTLENNGNFLQASRENLAAMGGRPERISACCQPGETLP